MGYLAKPTAVTKTRSVMPAATGSSTAYWIKGFPTTDTICLGLVFLWLVKKDAKSCNG
jgi:hypothetical protein